jgi:hypothetical protein
LSKKNKKNGGKLSDSWIGTNANGDFFHADYKKDREYTKIIGIADIPHQDLPDWKQGKTSKTKKEKKNG